MRNSNFGIGVLHVKVNYIFGDVISLLAQVFSSAVPPGSGAFQMPTCPSSSSSAAASTLRGGRANLRNASVTFSLFSSAVPPGSGAFQMPTCPSASSSSASASSASTLRGGKG